MVEDGFDGGKGDEGGEGGGGGGRGGLGESGGRGGGGAEGGETGGARGGSGGEGPVHRGPQSVQSVRRSSGRKGISTELWMWQRGWGVRLGVHACPKIAIAVFGPWPSIITATVGQIVASQTNILTRARRRSRWGRRRGTIACAAVRAICATEQRRKASAQSAAAVVAIWPGCESRRAHLSHKCMRCIQPLARRHHRSRRTDSRSDSHRPRTPTAGAATATAAGARDNRVGRSPCNLCNGAAKEGRQHRVLLRLCGNVAGSGG